MKNSLIVIASLLVSVAAQAQNCFPTNLELNPSAETANVCASLRLQGPASLKACSSHDIELTVAAGGVYAMTGLADSLVSKTEFTDDETQTTVTTLVNLNLVSQVYSGQVIVADRRGHRSVVNCAGTLEIK